MKLYSYYRSSAAYRVRIALNLKNLACEMAYVHLRLGEQKSAEYTALNPQGLVPTLEVEGGQLMTQSLAIMEYLEEAYPDTPLLPKQPLERARVRAICQLIACDTHPVNNLRILGYLRERLAIEKAAELAWYHHWIHEGFRALEVLLQDAQTGKFCHGDTPSLADCCLVPQVYNARRFEMDLSAYPTICRIVEACEALPAFQKASPEAQADAE